MLTVSVKTAFPSAMLAFEQETVPPAPTAGVVQLQPPGDDSDAKAVPTGSVSDSDMLAALLGPLFVTVIEYVRLLPALTGSGLSVFVTDTSADVLTVVVAVALSLPALLSPVPLSVAVFEITVPVATLASTFTVNVNTALPTAIEAFVQLTVPPAPIAGVVQLQPPGDENDTNVVPAGSVSDIDAFAALLGPALATVIV
jgi:hypothetical protein